MPSTCDESGSLFDRSFIARYDPNSGFRVSVDSAQNLGTVKGIPFLSLFLIEKGKTAEEPANLRHSNSMDLGMSLSVSNEKDERIRGVQNGPSFEEIRQFIKSDETSEEEEEPEIKSSAAVPLKETQEDDSRFVRKLDYNSGQKTPTWRDGFQVSRVVKMRDLSHIRVMLVVPIQKIRRIPRSFD